MQNIWMLSPTAIDGSGNTYPTCNAYASAWTCPAFPVAAGTPAPIVHVQDAAGTSSCTFGSSVAVGDLIFVTVVYGWTTIGAPSTTVAVTDNGGNNYFRPVEADALMDSSTGNGGMVFANFYTIATAAATTITASVTGATTLSVKAHEYSGVDGVKPLLVTNAGYSGLPKNTAVYTAPTLTVHIPVTTAGELIFAVGGASANLGVTCTTGYTLRDTTTYTVSPATWTTHGWELISSGGDSSVSFTATGTSDSNSALWGYLFCFQPKVQPTGLGLVWCQSTDTQIAAANADSTITVCPTDYNQMAPKVVTDSYYAQGAITGMSMASLLSLLGSTYTPGYLVDPTVLNVTKSLPYYMPTGTSSTLLTQSAMMLAANGILITPMSLPYPVTFSQIYAALSGTDTTNLHSFGIYDIAGNLIVAATPTVYPSNGVFGVSTTVLSAGVYYVAWTCNGTTAVTLPGVLQVVPGWMMQGTSSQASGGALPATISTPQEANLQPVSAPVLAIGLF